MIWFYSIYNQRDSLKMFLIIITSLIVNHLLIFIHLLTEIINKIVVQVKQG